VPGAVGLVFSRKVSHAIEVSPIGVPLIGPATNTTFCSFDFKSLVKSAVDSKETIVPSLWASTSKLCMAGHHDELSKTRFSNRAIESAEVLR
jgi:hypothetical protein